MAAITPLSTAAGDVAAVTIASNFYQVNALADPDTGVQLAIVAAGARVSFGDVVTTARKINNGAVQSVVGSAIYLKRVRVHNTGDVLGYLRLYNHATTPTIGATADYVIPCPLDFSIPPEEFVGRGKLFSLGLAMAVTTGMAENDTDHFVTTKILVEFQYGT